ncbi:MAG: hypothetical protein ACRD5L_01280, partial [Bryobacteraceae bacterium]
LSALSSDRYTWVSPGGISVSIRFDAMERMSMDIMRGFGSVPKRGAEVGGLLLGRIAPGESGTTVQIEDYLLIPIEYRRGPSYLLSENDIKAFDEALRAARANGDPKPAGFFRSHTREGPGLTSEDVEFGGHRFPDPWSVILLVKPQVMSVSTAGFMLKQDGRFPEGAPPFEFPFRRRDLDPGSAETRPRRRHEPDQTLDPVALSSIDPALVWQTRITPISAEFNIPRPGAFYWLRASWWVALLLVLGGVLGYLGRVCLEDFQGPLADFYRLNLSADASGSTLTVHWNGVAPAVAGSSRGRLTIDDGALHRAIDLNRAQLCGGSLVYSRDSNAVRFRMDVFPAGNASVSETLDWSQ